MDEIYNALLSSFEASACPLTTSVLFVHVSRGGLLEVHSPLSFQMAPWAWTTPKANFESVRIVTVLSCESSNALAVQSALLSEPMCWGSELWLLSPHAELALHSWLFRFHLSKSCSHPWRVCNQLLPEECPVDLLDWSTPVQWQILHSKPILKF